MFYQLNYIPSLFSCEAAKLRSREEDNYFFILYEVPCIYPKNDLNVYDIYQ